MEMTDAYLVFSVEEVRCALHVEAVKRIVHAVEVTHLPAAPDFICGLINVAGDIIPVIDMRQRLGLPSRELELSDRLILTNVTDRPMALLVDRVEGVVELPAHSVTSIKTAANDATSRAVTIEENIVLIQSMEALVSEVDLSEFLNAERNDIDE